MPVIWNIRHSLGDPTLEHANDARPSGTQRRRLSRSAAAIIYNSQAAAREHEAIGFSNNRATYIPNGFDCDLYKPDRRRRDHLRMLFDIADDAVVVATGRAASSDEGPTRCWSAPSPARGPRAATCIC